MRRWLQLEKQFAAGGADAFPGAVPADGFVLMLVDEDFQGDVAGGVLFHVYLR